MLWLMDKNLALMYTMSRGTILNCMIFGMALLGVVAILRGYKETFMPLGTGLYPETEDGLILDGDYPIKKNAGLSDFTYEEESTLYPVNQVGSYTQTTNNKEFWKIPCNGTAAPADFCGGLYDDKTIPLKRGVPAPKQSCLRVNYYCSV